MTSSPTFAALSSASTQVTNSTQTSTHDHSDIDQIQNASRGEGSERFQLAAVSRTGGGELMEIWRGGCSGSREPAASLQPHWRLRGVAAPASGASVTGPAHPSGLLELREAVANDGRRHAELLGDRRCLILSLLEGVEHRLRGGCGASARATRLPRGGCGALSRGGAGALGGGRRPFEAVALLGAALGRPRSAASARSCASISVLSSVIRASILCARASLCSMSLLDDDWAAQSTYLSTPAEAASRRPTLSGTDGSRPSRASQGYRSVSRPA